jgi:hypothetical protein
VTVAPRLLVALRAVLVGLSVMLCASLAAAAPARADPIPGFDLDPAALEQRMHDCLGYVVDDKFLLMGWVNLQSGQQRRWYCSSLRHMYIRAGGGTVHDPFVDVDGFMRCVDRVVSHGFPRPGDPGNTRLIYQYLGVERQAVVVVNDATGDIASMWTTPADDWTTCARWSP